MNKLPHLSKGSLLIASPNLQEELYKQSVVLLCEYTTYGSFGLILNKPLSLDTSEDPGLSIEEITHLKESLRIGGTMQQNQLMLLHSSDKNKDQTLQISDQIYLGGDFSFLQDLVREEPNSPLLLCFGYTGWTAGELENQCVNELWYPHPATHTLIFETPPEHLWRKALSQLGAPYTNLTQIPDDLSQN